MVVFVDPLLILSTHKWVSSAFLTEESLRLHKVKDGSSQSAQQPCWELELVFLRSPSAAGIPCR